MHAGAFIRALPKVCDCSIQAECRSALGVRNKVPSSSLPMRTLALQAVHAAGRGLVGGGPCTGECSVSIVQQCMVGAVLQGWLSKLCWEADLAQVIRHIQWVPQWVPMHSVAVAGCAVLLQLAGCAAVLHAAASHAPK